VLDQSKTDFCFIDTTDYDFIIASSKPVLADTLLKKAIPFTRFVMDKTTDYMEIDRSKEILMVDRNHVIGVEVIEKNCFVHTTDEIIMVRRVPMGRLLETLDMPELVRCHKSYAVNVKYVKGFKRESRTRWKIKFFVDTEFDARVTNLYMDDVMEKCESYHGINFSKNLRY
jgi:DNA-binding LytR/AlgR family response regulator